MANFCHFEETGMSGELASAKGDSAAAQQATKDRPWLFRTYSGHSSARESNALYRSNLDKGQTGLSVAFDLPTQTGYDADHPLAKGEVGKVGVPIGHLGDMEQLFDGIPLDQMNTSMTINAPAAWSTCGTRKPCLPCRVRRDRMDRFRVQAAAW